MRACQVRVVSRRASNEDAHAALTFFLSSVVEYTVLCIDCNSRSIFILFLLIIIIRIIMS